MDKEYIEITKDNWEQYEGQEIEVSDSPGQKWITGRKLGYFTLSPRDSGGIVWRYARILVPTTKKPKPPTGVTKRTGVTVYTKIDGTTTESKEEALMQAMVAYIDESLELKVGGSRIDSLAKILLDDTKRKQFLEGAAKARKVTTAKKGQKK